MKRFYTIATALLLVGGSFSSCTKDLDEVSVMNASVSQDAKGLKTNNSGKVDADVSVNFSNNTPSVGSEITVSVVFNSNTPSGGKLHLEQEQLNSEGLLTWVKIADFDVTQGQAQYNHNFTSNVEGTVKFRAHYIAQGTVNFSNTFAYGNVTFVNSECTEGMVAEVTKAQHLAGDNYRITVSFTLKTCADYTNVHIQGGLTAHVTNIETEGQIRKETGNGNHIIQWDEVSLAAGSKTYSVTFDKEMTGSGIVTGNWSAEVNGIKVAETAGGAYFNPNDWK
jgi:hypothetical protein